MILSITLLRSGLAASAIVLALAVAGCGRRGPPEPPGAAVETPVAAAPYGGLTTTSGVAPFDSGSISPPKGAAASEPGGPTKKPPRTFALDPLL